MASTTGIPRAEFAQGVNLLRKVEQCTLDNAASFSEFVVDFEKAYNDMKISLGPPEGLREFKFLMSLGPRYDDWIRMIFGAYSIAGMGTGPPISFDALIAAAENQYYHFVRADHSLSASENQSFVAGYLAGLRAGQKQAAGDREGSSTRPSAQTNIHSRRLNKSRRRNQQ
jgi:hypothetical protein